VAPEGNTVLATMLIDAWLSGYRRLLRWAAGFAQRRWAVETPAAWAGTWLTQGSGKVIDGWG
jgi:hypothetical protein